MEWRDEGIIIGGRRYGETSVILEIMTRGHGRHPGLVRGGRSKRMQPLLQPGNAVSAVWRARLEDQLGTYAIEPMRLRAAELIETPGTLHGLNLVLAHLRLLAEREPHAELHDMAAAVLDHLSDATLAPGLMIRFELALLAECGFGLDLDRCAATGVKDDLIYVSPKSARAVSRAAGTPYRDRLLPLPAFLLGDPLDPVGRADLAAGFRLAGYFLDRNLFAPRGLPMPAARHAYVGYLGLAGTRAVAADDDRDVALLPVRTDTPGD